tara:strand:- start:3076 stop:4179 length:1104 start_codon:yes stop_codon:yes gene_type:complete
MSYRDPKQVVDTRISTVNKGIANMLSGISKTAQSHALDQQKKKEAATKALDKVVRMTRETYDKSYETAKAASDKFTSGLRRKDASGRYSQTKDALSFSTQVQDQLVKIGDDLNDQIKEIQNAGGSSDQIQKAKLQAINRMNKFTVDMQNWEAARLEYMEARLVDGQDPGSLVADADMQENADMITMFEAMLDDKDDDDLFITIDDDGNTRISQGTIGQGGAVIRNSTDLSALAQNAQQTGGYFQTNTAFKDTDFDKMVASIEDIQNTAAFLEDPTKPPSNKGPNKNQLDEQKVKDYFMQDDTGRGAMNGYFEDDWKSQLSSLGIDSSLYAGQTSAAKNKELQEMMRTKVLDQAWNKYFNKMNKPTNQ